MQCHRASLKGEGHSHFKMGGGGAVGGGDKLFLVQTSLYAKIKTKQNKIKHTKQHEPKTHTWKVGGFVQ